MCTGEKKQKTVILKTYALKRDFCKQQKISFTDKIQKLCQLLIIIIIRNNFLNADDLLIIAMGCSKSKFSTDHRSSAVMFSRHLERQLIRKLADIHYSSSDYAVFSFHRTCASCTKNLFITFLKVV